MRFCPVCGNRLAIGARRTTGRHACEGPERFDPETGARLDPPAPDGPNLYPSSLADAGERSPPYGR